MKDSTYSRGTSPRVLTCWAPKRGCVDITFIFEALIRRPTTFEDRSMLFRATWIASMLSPSRAMSSAYVRSVIYCADLSHLLVSLLSWPLVAKYVLVQLLGPNRLTAKDIRRQNVLLTMNAFKREPMLNRDNHENSSIVGVFVNFWMQTEILGWKGHHKHCGRNSFFN